MPQASTSSEARELIETLYRGRVRAQCPRCEQEFPLKRAELFHLDDFSEAGLAWLENAKAEIKARREELKRRPRAASSRSELAAGAVNLGSLLERIAPTLPSFPFSHPECRALFDPIDYIAFPGAELGCVESVEFVEIKSGESRLTKRQRQIRDAINDGRVSLSTYPRE